MPSLLQLGPCQLGDTPRNDFDGRYCLNKVYQAADKELNANDKKLAARLDANGKQTLKAGQLAWIGKRNKSCSKRESSGFYVNLDCATQTTIERAQFLQDRVRECVSAGCQNSKLSAVHALAPAEPSFG